MAEKKLVLVTGATGQQGGAVARELLAHNYAVRALTRNPTGAKAQALAKLGATVVQGDYEDTASLQRALDGVWGAFSVQNTWEAGVAKEEQQGKQFAELAKQAGVQHFVYSSVCSAQRHTDIPHFDNKWRIEETVRKLGFPTHTILRPVFFMDNWVSAWFKPAIDNGQVAIGIKPETVLQMIAVADIGKYGRWAFDYAQQLNGKALDIAGDALTMPQVAKLIGAAAGRPMTFVSVPIEEVRKYSQDFAIMLEWFDRVGYDADIAARSKESGIRPTLFKDWVKTATWS
jgi:uncharacterized protein YbjT (DUF2867 family)